MTDINELLLKILDLMENANCSFEKICFQNESSCIDLDFLSKSLESLDLSKNIQYNLIDKNINNKIYNESKYNLVLLAQEYIIAERLVNYLKKSNNIITKTNIDKFLNNMKDSYYISFSTTNEILKNYLLKNM